MSSENKKPTLKQKRFAKAIANGASSATEAVYEAGYTPKSRENARKIGYALMQKAHVLATVEKELDKLSNGNARAIAAQTILDIAQNGQTENSRLKAADMIIKATDGYAPQKKANVTVDISDKWKLPEE
jgi:phage terminase small subunit